MISQLVFATNNQHKVDEIMVALPDKFSILTLKQAGISIEIPEPHDTLEDNASEKARTIHAMVHQPCFSEDTGLEVFALNMAPGVRSARYAGETNDPDANMQKLLRELEPHSDRTARFRTVICLILDGEEHFFEGICEGIILEQAIGEKGFGYDPLFVPAGADRSFAQMNRDEKNRYSHRRKAADQLVTFLNRLE